MRGVAFACAIGKRLFAVEIAQAHIERVQFQPTRDVAHDGLDQDDALWAAKAAKGGVALRVGLAAVGGNLHMLQVIGVVAVEDGAVRHRAGQVGAPAAVGGHHQLQGGEAPAVVKTCGVLVFKRMALAGDHEVVVAVQPQFDGAAEFFGCHRRPYRQMAGLGFLATKTAAHAAAFDAHRVVVDSQRVRHPMLHLAGMLGAAVHRPLVLLQGHHIGNLALQIKMLLAADLQRAGELVLGIVHGSRCIAASHMNRRQHIALRCQGLLDAQDGGKRLNVQQHPARRVPGLQGSAGNHEADDLTDILHRIRCKHRLVTGKGGQLRVAGNVPGQDDIHHAGHCQSDAGVHALEAAMGHRGKNRCGVQGAAQLGQVVDVMHGTCHLGGCAFMVHRDARSGGGGLRCGVGCLAHAASPSSTRVSNELFAAPWLSSQ